jgi:hypothetical protein
MKISLNLEIKKHHFYILLGLFSVLSILLIANGAYVGHSWDDINGGSPILSSLKVTGDVEVVGKLNASNGIKIGAGVGDEGILRWNDTLKAIEINNGSEWNNITLNEFGDTVIINNINSTNLETININTTNVQSTQYCNDDSTICKTLEELNEANDCSCAGGYNCWETASYNTCGPCSDPGVQLCTPEGLLIIEKCVTNSCS